MNTALIGAFHNTEEARAAVASLKEAGFASDAIGLMAKDDESETTFRTFKELEGNHAGKGAAIGAATGAGAGALWALGIAAGFLPAIGPFVTGGIFGAVAASTAAGAAIVGMAGALSGLGVTDEEVAYYEDEFRKGSTVVAVACKSAEEFAEALEIMNTRHAYYGKDPRYAKSA